MILFYLFYRYNELNPQNKLDTIKDMKDSLGNKICDPINTHIQCSSLVVINKEMHDGNNEQKHFRVF